jgi:hypothetical protein
MNGTTHTKSNPTLAVMGRLASALDVPLFVLLQSVG